MNRVLGALLCGASLFLSGCPGLNLDDLVGNGNTAGNNNSNNNNSNGNGNANSNSNANANDNQSGRVNRDFDGNWQLTLLNRNGLACLAIRDGVITSWNEGCTNTFLNITGSQPVFRAGDTAVWNFRTTDITGGNAFQLNTTVQRDGNLLGTVIVDDPRGDRFEDEFIMVRR